MATQEGQQPEALASPLGHEETSAQYEDGGPENPRETVGSDQRVHNGLPEDRPAPREKQSEIPPGIRILRPRHSVSFSVQDDKALKKALERVRKTHGGLVKLKICKRGADGKYSFLPGQLLEIDPTFDDLDGLEAKIGSLHGGGDYRVTFLCPPASNLEPFSICFSILDSDPGRDGQAPPPSVGESNPPEDDPKRPTVAELLELAKGSSGGSGSDPNILFIGFATQMMEKMVATLDRKIDRLADAFEAASKASAERPSEAPQPAPDPAKTLEGLANTAKVLLECARPPVVQPPPPPSTTGPNDMERTLALVGTLLRMFDSRTPPAPPQPVTVNDALTGQLLAFVKSELERKDTPRKGNPILDQFKTFAEVTNIVRQTGLGPEAVGAIGQVLDEAEEELENEEPSAAQRLFSALSPYIKEAARGFGASLGQGLAALGPNLVNRVIPGEGNPPHPSPQEGGKGPGASSPPPPPKRRIFPFPTPPGGERPVPPSSGPAPRTPEAPHVPGQPGGLSPDARPATSAPVGTPRGPASFLRTAPPMNPAGPRRAVLTDEQFAPLIALLQAQEPEETVAEKVLALAPVGMLPLLREPVDKLLKIGEYYTTPTQWAALKAFEPRIRGILEALKTLVGRVGPQQ